tara:strand:+ start:132 stop:386 length:255 start_codon:yes stop_codon:yes gene_type:complete
MTLRYQCPVCGETSDSIEETSDHVENEHPNAFAQLRGLEVPVERNPAHDEPADLVELVSSWNDEPAGLVPEEHDDLHFVPDVLD